MHRLIVVIAAALSGLATLSLLFFGLESSGIQSPQVRLDAIKSVRLGRFQLSQIRDQQPDAKRVAFLGDSTAVAYPFPHTVPLRLQAALSRLPGFEDNRVISFGFSGMNASDYYFVSQLVLDTDPDAVVMAFNLASLSEAWRASLTRPELAGWIPPGRVFEAMTLPLHQARLSLDEMLLYMGIVNTGSQGSWLRVLREQARVSSAMDALIEHLNSPRRERVPLAQHRSFIAEREPQRETAYRVTQRYGRAFAGITPDHATLAWLQASLNRFLEAGVPVIVYVVPINHEHFAELGAFADRGLDETLASVREIAEAKGASLVDLHDLIPDEGFRDGSGHFTHESPNPGPTWVGAELAPVVAGRIEGSSGRRD
jgi:hypothetical protein